MLCGDEASDSFPILIRPIFVTLDFGFPSRLTAVVFVLQSSGSPVREKFNQQFLDSDRIVAIVYAANLDAVCVMDWVDCGVVAQPIEPAFTKFSDDIGADLEQFRRESEDVTFVFVGVTISIALWRIVGAHRLGEQF